MRKYTLAAILLMWLSATGTLFAQQPVPPLTDAFRYAADKPCYVSAHRGGRFLPNLPENALETFVFTHHQTPRAFIECDVAETKDKTLVLMHDASLDRTTTLSGKLTSYTWDEIKDARLKDDFGKVTPYHIPLFNKVLKWAKKEGIILQVDIKRGVSFSNVIHTLEKYEMEEQVIIITYNLQDAQKAYKLNHDLLIAVTIRNTEEWERFKNANIPYKNIIAFTGTKDKSAEIFTILHKNNISCIFGSLGNIDKKAEKKGIAVYWELIEKGVDVFATDRPAAVQQAIDIYPNRHEKRKKADAFKHKNP